MTADEKAKRIAAWGWAAITLGVEAGPDRVMGLVEVTKSVRLEHLKPALEAVIKTEPAGFLPSPGAVIEAAKRIVDRQHAERPRLQSGEMSHENHLRWMEKNNPDGWDTPTWRAFSERMANDPLYEKRVKSALADRHAWAADEVVRQIGGRRVSNQFRLDLRRQINDEAFERYPRPHPLEDGWVPAAQFDPIAGLAKRMQA